MKFGSPEFFKWLLLLLPLIAIVIVLHRQRAKRLAQLISSSVWKTVIPGHSRKRSRRRTMLRVMALLCIGLALTRPQWGFKWEEVRQRGLDIIVVLDTSKSMLAADIKPNRLQQAKWAVRDFVRHLKGDRIGLIAFAGSSFLQCPTTIDYAAFTMMLNDLYAGIIPKGGTAIAQALETAADSFDTTSEADRVIILITDGEDHEGKPLEMVENLKRDNIRLYSIGVGTPEGELIPAAGGGYVKDQQGRMVKSSINEGLLEQVARETGGFYVRSAPGDFGLDRIYKLGISNLQQDEQETRLAKVYEERFGWFAAAALLFLFAEGLLRAPKVALLLLLFLLPNLGQAETETKFPSVKTYNEGYELYRANDYAGAEKCFNDVAAQTDDEKLKQKAFYNRGTALFAGAASGAISNRLEAVATAIDLFELSLELKPDDMDSKLNLERALDWMISGRISQSTKLINEADQMLSQDQAKTAKENYTEAKETLSPIQDDFAPNHKALRPLIDRADGQLQMLERAIELTRKEMITAKVAVDRYDYKRAANLMVSDKPERRWAFDIDEDLANEFQQLIQNNQNVIQIVYPPNPLKP
jgi:Ca-activated chloride channel homolog